MKYLAFRMSGFGGKYITMKVVVSNDGNTYTRQHGESLTFSHYTKNDGVLFDTLEECQDFCQKQNQ